MLALLQRGATLGLLALAMLWAAYCWHRAEPAWALYGTGFLLTGHAWLLACEFLWMAHVNKADAAPHATAVDSLAAWWGEVLSAPHVFCWLQPFRSQRWPDYLPPSTRGCRGVLLVHGFVCNRGLWNPWLKRLRAQRVPYAAINLEPVFGSIEDYCALIEQGVASLERATGMAPIVVAHSMGGLAVRHWWANNGERARVHHAITIGTPHHGTRLARFALSPNARQMRRDSRWLRRLQIRESTHLPNHAAHFTCYYSHCDNIVFPASSATLAGADNRHLPAVAHVRMCSRDEPFDELMRLLSRR